MPLIIPGGCGSRLTISSEATVYTVMNNIYDQKPLATVPYDFEPGFTQDLVIAYPIQIRVPATTSSVSFTSSLTSTPKHSDSVMPVGAIIGVAFGGFFSIFFVCLSIYLILRSRRKKRQTEEGLGVSNTSIVGRHSGPNEQNALPGTYNPAAMIEYANQSPIHFNRKSIPQQSWNSQVGSSF